MEAIEKDIHIAAPIERVWGALTDPQMIEAWMGRDSLVAVDLKVGGHYQFFHGTTVGEFTHIDPPRSLAYTWRRNDWESTWPDSVVHWELRPEGDGTRVHLTHDGFPTVTERDDHERGWDLYWLNPMKDWLESSETER